MNKLLLKANIWSEFITQHITDTSDNRARVINVKLTQTSKSNFEAYKGKEVKRFFRPGRAIAAQIILVYVARSI